MNDIKTIDMGKYGQAGTIEICKPSMRKLNMMKNALGKCTETKQVNGQTVVTDIKVGDAALIRTLSYVKRAPFSTELDGFLTYCDMMDEADLGSAERMVNDIDAVIEELKAAVSPLGNSQEAETQTLV